MKKYLSIILVALFFFSVIGLSLHHHEDGHVHDDCPVCVVASHHQTVKTAIINGVPPTIAVFALSVLIAAHIPTVFYKNLNARAPPF
ncbi:MAG: DUF2946 domain-containing protein [Deltaproteobacteria bacterium]|nr:DUF2946 domain-containing protein [Deltaproteobacteria bacterium]